jgi:hypothetical protein
LTIAEVVLCGLPVEKPSVLELTRTSVGSFDLPVAGFANIVSRLTRAKAKSGLKKGVSING